MQNFKSQLDRLGYDFHTINNRYVIVSRQSDFRWTFASDDTDSIRRFIADEINLSKMQG